jgi:hypothetical protein
VAVVFMYVQRSNGVTSEIKVLLRRISLLERGKKERDEGMEGIKDRKKLGE